MASVVAEGDRRTSLSARHRREMEAVAGFSAGQYKWRPDGSIVQDARAFTPTIYGLTDWSDLFTPRQLVALTALTELVREASDHLARSIALAAGML